MEVSEWVVTRVLPPLTNLIQTDGEDDFTQGSRYQTSGGTLHEWFRVHVAGIARLEDTAEWGHEESRCDGRSIAHGILVVALLEELRLDLLFQVDAEVLDSVDVQDADRGLDVHVGEQGRCLVGEP